MILLQTNNLFIKKLIRKKVIDRSIKAYFFVSEREKHD